MERNCFPLTLNEALQEDPEDAREEPGGVVAEVDARVFAGGVVPISRLLTGPVVASPVDPVVTAATVGESVLLEPPDAQMGVYSQTP